MRLAQMSSRDVGLTRHLVTQHPARHGGVNRLMKGLPSLGRQPQVSWHLAGASFAEGAVVHARGEVIFKLVRGGGTEAKEGEEVDITLRSGDEGCREAGAGWPETRRRGGARRRGNNRP